MDPKTRDTGAIKLEEEFFARENKELLDKLRRKADQENRREALRKVLRIKDEAYVDRLLSLGINAETALALRLIPLVFVAWADGAIDDREREALLKAAQRGGVDAEETGLSLLSAWLRKKPDPSLLDLWKSYVKGLWDHFTRDEQLKMRQNLLQSAREVAEAAGGFLGLTSRVSAQEKAVLEELEKQLD